MAKGHNVPPPPPPAERDDIDPQERAAQRRFIKARWAALAALAWESYQAEGRGAVVLHVVSTQGIGKTEAVYVSARGLQAQGQPWPDPDTARLAAEYQPEHEIGIVVEREHGGASTYRMAAHPSPPEAYRRRARKWRAVDPMSDHDPACHPHPGHAAGQVPARGRRVARRAPREGADPRRL